jgi:hypothetical protein
VRADGVGGTQLHTGRLVQVQQVSGLQRLLPDGSRHLEVLGDEPALAAARSWTQARWAPPAVPSGGSAVSFSLALRSDGTLATSQYSLVPVRYSSTRLIAFSVVVAALVVAVAVVGARRSRRRGA